MDAGEALITADIQSMEWPRAIASVLRTAGLVTRVDDSGTIHVERLAPASGTIRYYNFKVF
jgi:hypothetical protein